MSEEIINELLEKLKQCDDFHNRCDFLMEHSEITYMLDYITNLQQENKKLKKQLEEKNKPQIFIDTKDMEERYAEGLYQDYLEEENKKLKEELDKLNHIIDKQDRDIVILSKGNKELKKQLEEANEKILLLQASEPMLEYKKALEENQQKEFIEYMSKTIEELECDDVGDEELKGYLIQEIDTFKEILSKYEEIIEK